MSPPTIRSQSLKRAIDRLDAIGADSDGLLRRFGFSRTHTHNPLRRVSFQKFVAFYHAAAEVSGDPYLGLHIGENTELDSYDTLGHAARCCEQFGDALKTLCRYLRVLEDGSNAYLHCDADHAYLRYELTALSTHNARQTIELGLCVFHRWGQSLLRREWPLTAVSFSHAAPGDTDEHTRIFAAPVRFSQPTNELVFSANWLATPLDSADSHLRKVMEDNLQRVSQSLTDGSGLTDLVRERITASLSQGEPTIDAVARQLGMSKRTLQRRLKEQAHSFVELLDSVRRELARTYLHDDQLSPGEVAFSLGYADISAFYHAFKRWYGTTPAVIRKTHPTQRRHGGT